MKTFLSGVLRRVRQLRRGLRLETLGLSIPPFMASFKIKHPHNKTTISEVVQRVPVQTHASPLEILWETVDSMTEAERKRAMRRRDWETAILASLVQCYIRAQRGDTSGGRA